MAFVQDKKAIQQALEFPFFLETRLRRGIGFPDPPTDVNVNKFRRISSQIFPDPLSILGKAFHHKIFHFTFVPVEGGSIDTNIMWETIPPHPVLKGTARHHKVYTPDPLPVEGGNVDTNILFETIPPHPVLAGRIFRDSGILTFHVSTPILIDLIFHETINKQPEPNLGLLFRTRTTVRRDAKSDPPTFVEFTHIYQQAYRVADAVLDIFQLFIGEDALPDFTSFPSNTSPTLPLSLAITPPAVGTKAVNVVVRKQNAFGLASFNVFETRFVIDTAGNEVLGPITPPEIIKLFDGTIGRAVTFVQYVGNDINPANAWEIYAKVGVDPIPGVDTPVVTGSMLFVGSIASFRADLGDFTPGATLHVIATAIRTVDSERGNAPVAMIVLKLSPDLDEGTAFGGDVSELR